MDGLLLVDKPAHMTSHDVIDSLRKILRQKTVGHTGTLDPLATGLMVVVLGEATKLSDYLMTVDKSYRVKVALGLTTDTLDIEGQILSETQGFASREDIESAVKSLNGEFKWPVPLFSAAKIDGKKLYDYARQGESVSVPVKTMKFWECTTEKIEPRSVEVSLSCSKGSFVRTWASQLGEVLGLGGVVAELRRTRVGIWSIDQAIGLNVLSEAPELANGQAFIPLSEALPTLKSVMAGPRDAKLMVNGQIPRNLQARLIFEQKTAYAHDQAVFVKVMTGSGELLAILAAEPKQGLKIRRVFKAHL